MTHDDTDYPVIRYDEDDEAGKGTAAHRAAAPIHHPPVRPYLVVVAGDESVGRCIPVTDGMIIGRGTAADVSLAGSGISRRHARVSIVDDGSLYFEDCGSSNGIAYGGVRVSSQTVREGERVGLGATVLVALMIEDDGFAFERNIFLSATEDAVTRLAHRSHFLAVAARECELAARYGVPTSFLVTAIDQHHQLLAEYGAAFASSLFKAVSHVVRARAGPRTVIARRDVDMLAILLPETRLEEAAAWADELRSGVQTVGVERMDERLAVTLSVGVVAASEERAPDMQRLLDRAEARLAVAKARGGDRVIGAE
jgi:diguanylate cyclase (GGDEF)-like protein